VTLTVMLALAATAQATPTRTIDSVLTGATTGTAGWCCGGVWFFEGSTVIPSIGKLNFTGTYTAGQIPEFLGGPMDEVRALSLTFTTPDGSTLVLRSELLTWLAGATAPPLAWAVSEATGRFAGYSGTGVYTAATGATTVSISLSGSLRG
jgi:hypothetical protein